VLPFVNIFGAKTRFQVADAGKQGAGDSSFRTRLRLPPLPQLPWIRFHRWTLRFHGQRFNSIERRLDAMQEDMKSLNKAKTALEIDVALVKDKIGL
jgi:hypothetical protein